MFFLISTLIYFWVLWMLIESFFSFWVFGTSSEFYLYSSFRGAILVTDTSWLSKLPSSLTRCGRVLSHFLSFHVLFSDHVFIFFWWGSNTRSNVWPWNQKKKWGTTLFSGFTKLKSKWFFWVKKQPTTPSGTVCPMGTLFSAQNGSFSQKSSLPPIRLTGPVYLTSKLFSG